jgi:hypothetical protein
MIRCRDEWLFPCEAHADLGFHASFEDGRYEHQNLMFRRMDRRKGVLVTTDLLPTLVPGQVLRIRSNACAEENGQATVGDRLIGAWHWIVGERNADGDVSISQTTVRMSSVYTLSTEVLAANEVRLVSRGEERWPTGPVWVLKYLESQVPRRTSPVV